MPASLSPSPAAAPETVAGEAPGGRVTEPKVLGLGPRLALAFLIAAAMGLAVIGYYWWDYGGTDGSEGFSAAIAYRVGVVVVLMLFMPFTAVSFYVVRRDVRRRQLREDCRALGLDYEHYYHIYKRETRESHFLYAVCFTSVVTLLGLTAVMLGMELGLNEKPNLLLLGAFEPISDAAVSNYQTGTLLFFGMAFLGAYLWGLQHILHRYYTSDLMPAVYYGLGTRMIFAAIIALMVYHMLPDVAEPAGAEGALASSFLPALAFMIGIFPQRALQYLTDRMSSILSPTDATAREVPLELIQGISVNDRLRLAEEGIESCFDLANAEFVQLLFTTPYQPLELIDWQLQARMVLYFGRSAEEMRDQGIRTISDLKRLDDAAAQELAERTSTTKAAVAMARARAQEDGSVEFLESLRRTLVSGQAVKKCGGTAPAEAAAVPAGADGQELAGQERVVIAGQLQPAQPRSLPERPGNSLR
ncbi:MAG: hypothetical protein Tsb0032_25080 [Kiloniellaceae bacterium]